LKRVRGGEIITADLQEPHSNPSPGHVNKQAKLIDAVLISHFQELRSSTAAMVAQMNEQKSHVLNRFETGLMPLAHEVINQILNDAKQLQSHLDQNLENSQTIASSDWTEHAKVLTQLYSKWHNQAALTDKVLELVEQRTAFWIDKDCQVIEDYQKQSIAHLSQDSEEFKNLEERLAQATAEPLKQLLSLRQTKQKHESLKQASEWLANFQFQRESCFDQLLMKIDMVVQEIVQTDDFDDANTLLEVEGEILFMEREFQYLHQMRDSLSAYQIDEKETVQAGLESLLEHVEQFMLTLPKSLQVRVAKLQQSIQADLA
jgi:hypothetical protein